LNKAILAVLVCLIVSIPWNTAQSTEPLVLAGDRAQGGLLVGETLPGAVVKVDGRPIPISSDGYFLIGFGRDAVPRSVLSVQLPSGRTIERLLEVAQRTYKVSRIDGLPRRTVTPNPEDLRRIRDDNAKIAKVRKRVGTGTGFIGGFLRPAEGRISGVFGSRRILNGEPRRPHNGLDIAAPRGTPVYAAADGTVALVDPDMFLTGQTVMIDHGLGLTSVYIHMSDIAVTIGDRVTRGDRIGAIGMSGRATGPHLHWGVTLLSTHLDPALLIDEN